MIIKRTLEESIKKYLKLFPVVAINGPRQSGKTTLLKSAFPEYQYVSLENPDVRLIAESDPNSFLNDYPEKVIFDEVQRVPQLFSYIQTKVDNDKIPGQYILSGSQNFHLVQNITQSLAGRVAMFKLFPFDNQELKSANLLPQHFETLIPKGFYPVLFDREIPSDVFYQNYIETYIQRDLSEILNIRDLMAFRRFLRLCAGRSGQILNLSALAKDCGITQPTAKSWLSILESSFIVFLLEPYYENFNKRIIKSPKMYFYDTGLLCYLLNIPNAEKFIENRMYGNIFENFIVAEFFKENAHHYLLGRFWYWRDSNGNEVDMISETAGNFNIYEIKSTKTVSEKLFAGLHYFSENYPSKINEKTLVYGGENSKTKKNVKIKPWKEKFM